MPKGTELIRPTRLEDNARLTRGRREETRWSHSSHSIESDTETLVTLPTILPTLLLLSYSIINHHTVAYTLRSELYVDYIRSIIYRYRQSQNAPSQSVNKCESAKTVMTWPARPTFSCIFRFLSFSRFLGSRFSVGLVAHPSVFSNDERWR